MRALIFDTKLGSWEGTRGFELADVPEPVLNESVNSADADKVILKVHYAGICGTDRGIWNRAAFKDQILGSIKAEGGTRRILGHEFFGEIVAMGSKVNEVAPYPLKVGDFASPESHVVCNKCFQCKLGEKHVCTNEKILGISHDGGFAEFVKLPGHIVWKTDTSAIRPELGAMQEPFGNAVHAGSKVPLKGKTVAIFGLGPIGLFLILVARGLGASTIIGVEPNPVSQEMAKRLGIDYVIPLSVRESPLVKGVPESARGRDVKNTPPAEDGSA
ncbi:MAG: alcohol dehydrogenase catalytic domain-containing protein, partial [bacterium]|nr:alcohol dehydrogenase catalytic domain-containing protein [bacterium]